MRFWPRVLLKRLPILGFRSFCREANRCYGFLFFFSSLIAVVYVAFQLVFLRTDIGRKRRLLPSEL